MATLQARELQRSIADVASYFYANGNNIEGRPEVYIFDVIGDTAGEVHLSLA